ncbi:hypothetical protein ZWY2020_006544 [Hordeum vulgare]|nr:hypothetical protein ZWY2020_025323 [Hordeum vulgare]KAI5016693.1 hypothetical protein ZWY2020_006544 [Hordeum vulgare]
MVPLLPLVSPAKPPGFSRSPTLVLHAHEPLRRTPPLEHKRVVVVDDADLAPLFQERPEALLPTPITRTAKRPVVRRKKMVGLTIGCNNGGFSLLWTCACLKAAGRTVSKAKATPMGRAAVELIYHGLGITRDGQDVTHEMVAGLEEALISHGGDGALDQEA